MMPVPLNPSSPGQNLSGSTATLERLWPGLVNGLGSPAQERCCSATMASDDPVAASAVSNLLFQQSLLSLSSLVQARRGNGEAGQGASLQAAGKASARGATAAKGSKSSGGPLPGPGRRAGDGSSQLAIVSQFGQPGDRGNIVVSIAHKRAGPGGRMVPVQVHKKIADRLKNTFEISVRMSDEIKTFDGSYNARKREGEAPGAFTRGLAIDLNIA